MKYFEAGEGKQHCPELTCMRANLMESFHSASGAPDGHHDNSACASDMWPESLDRWQGSLYFPVLQISLKSLESASPHRSISSCARVNVLINLWHVKRVANSAHCIIQLPSWVRHLSWFCNLEILPCVCIALDMINGSRLSGHHIGNAIPSWCRVCFCLTSVFINSGENKFLKQKWVV